MSLIDEYIDQYSREYDYYLNLSQIVQTKIENELQEKAIKAIVTSRAKNPDRLKEKLEKRNKKEKYGTFSDIKRDIVDLAWARIALYFPSQRKEIKTVIQKLFDIEEEKEFPNKNELQEQTTWYKKRFSGYSATHYRVRLKKDTLYSRYFWTTVEIQVASVLMHAWSEVEHDIIYKPLSWDVSDEEKSILDEINWLVLSGEIALERLQSAMVERTDRTGKLSDKYEFTNWLKSKAEKGGLELWNTSIFNVLFSENEPILTGELEKYLKRLRKGHPNSKDTDYTVSWQLINAFIDAENEKHGNWIISYNDRLTSDRMAVWRNDKAMRLVKLWRTTETAIKYVNSTRKEDDNKIFFVTDIRIKDLKKRGIITEIEEIELRSIKSIRNEIVHDDIMPNEEELKMRFETLKQITLKISESINDPELKDKIIKAVARESGS